MPKKILKGKVIKKTGIKTVRVAVDVSRKHPFYLKTITRSKAYLVHDETDAKKGDLVTIEETKPISSKKRFKVIAGKVEE